jgi:hypothetical protein
MTAHEAGRPGRVRDSYGSGDAGISVTRRDGLLTVTGLNQRLCVCLLCSPRLDRPDAI